MFTQINSGGIRAVRGYVVSVEADVSNGLPGFSISGQLASEVRESQERVRTALRNSGFRFQAKKITVNLSPAGIHKGGTAYDLPIAIAVLGAFEQADTRGLKDSLVIGELGLDGRVKPISGVLPLVDAAREYGLKRCFLPAANAMEGRMIEGISIIGVESLGQMAVMLRQPSSIKPYTSSMEGGRLEEVYDVDFRDIRGQLVLRRAAEVAVAGMHGLFMNGSAGTGKTMVAKRLPTIMPSLTREEDIEISKIYSICGLLPPDRPLLSRRPFRSPHHTITPLALTGGGAQARPGELSLASGGILFLDELPHFSRGAVDILRQPLEEHKVTVTRVHGSYEFPADFMLVAAANPCPCGFYPDRSRCSCSELQIQRYLDHIPRPVLERFDICVDASPVTYEELNGTKGNGEDSASIRRRVEMARNIQAKRFRGTKIRFNSRMGIKETQAYCTLGQEEGTFLKTVYETKQLSARRYHKILKVARTIADLDGCAFIRRKHLSEALGYGMLEERVWG